MDKKIIYYEDELNDEFSPTKITPKKIDENYKYIRRGPIKFLTHIFWYRIVANPLAKIYLHKKFHHKIVNKKILKQSRHEAYFIYGNHTQDVADALIPTMVNNPKDTYVIVHPNNVSMPYLGRVTPSMGAMPLPDTIGASKNFIKAIKKRVEQKHAIMIYPEAHIWPYYTGIRNFKDTSFRYPIDFNTKVYCFTNCYNLVKGKIRITTYVDGPFIPDLSLSKSERRAKLRNEVYDKMKGRSALSDYKLIEYVKKEVS